MADTAGMFHVRNGLYFKRLDDGSVLLIKKDGADGPLVFEAAIDKDSWCSVVAHVCEHGPTPQMIEAAKIMHGLKTSEPPAT